MCLPSFDHDERGLLTSITCSLGRPCASTNSKTSSWLNEEQINSHSSAQTSAACILFVFPLRGFLFLMHSRGNGKCECGIPSFSLPILRLLHNLFLGQTKRKSNTTGPSFQKQWPAVPAVKTACTCLYNLSKHKLARSFKQAVEVNHYF